MTRFKTAAVAMVLAAALAALQSEPKISVSEWADQHRYLASESSPRPGKWSTDTTPYLREVMDCLTPSHPARRVVCKKGAQLGFTDAGINWLFTVADLYPGPCGLYEPTIDMVKLLNRTKWEPAVAATLRIAAIIVEQRSRAGEGSTALYKAFPGGFLLMSGANSSAAFQMHSLKYLMKDEISEWPFELEGRGDPYTMADKRTDAFSEECKIYEPSTPFLKGSCRVSKRYDESDRRRYHIPCPQCGEAQVLEWKNLKFEKTRPHGAHFVCIHNGCVIEHRDKIQMVKAGRWIAENPGAGRDPGFAIWQAYSPFKSWDRLVEDWLEAEGDPEAERVFTQQVLGEEWDEKGEAPEVAEMMKRRLSYKRGSVPSGVLFLTCGVDVQGDRLEYAVYGWGAGLTSWLIDVGVLDGDPNDGEVWARLDRVIDRQYEDAAGRLWEVEATGIDAGYLSHTVYAFVMRYAGTGRVYALDGRAGWMLPPIGSPSKRSVNFEGKRIGAVLLWPVGTWGMKSKLYAALRKTLRGPDEAGQFRPGTAHYADFCDDVFFEQLTAEYIADREKRGGRLVKEWVVKKGTRNEQHDLAVYARALAHHMSDQLSTEDWMNLAARRAAEPEKVQAELFALVNRPLEGAPPRRATPVEPTSSPPPPSNGADGQETPSATNWLGDRGRNWFGKG